MTVEKRRAYQAAYARKRRARALAEQNMDRTRCAALLARGKPCQTPLQSRFVQGTTVPFCPTCDRKARGLCIDCGTQPVAGQVRKALRCKACRKVAAHEALARYRDGHAAVLRKKERKRMADPVTRADRLEYKKLYRATMPTKVAAAKRADYQKHRDHYLEYHRQYRAARRADRAAVELARYRGVLPPRTCLSCPTVLTGRAKKCDPCKREQRLSARIAIAQRLTGCAA